MFRNLSTSTKLFILCSMFIVAIGVAIYSLVAEKQIAIEFARKELVGVRYFETLRGVYAAILAEPLGADAAGQTPSPEEVLKSLAAAERAAAGKLQTATLEQSLAATLSKLWSKEPANDNRSSLVVEALGKARRFGHAHRRRLQSRARPRSRQLLPARHGSPADAPSARGTWRDTDFVGGLGLALRRRESALACPWRHDAIDDRRNRTKFDVGLPRKCRWTVAASGRGRRHENAVQHRGVLRCSER